MKVKVFNDSRNELPKYETVGAAGLDIRADFSHNDLDNPIKAYGSAQFVPANEVQKTNCLYLDPGSRALIPTGLYVAIPEGYEIQVRSRSGLAAKNSVFVLNSPGTIDSDYRGEIKIILANLGDSDFSVSTGDRIAQMVLNKVEKIKFVVADDLDDTDRSSGGLGSTGV